LINFFYEFIKHEISKMKPDHNVVTQKLECPGCGSQNIHIFHDIKNVPVNSVLNCNTREAAKAFPRADISLGLCRQCGFIYNALFDSNLVRYSSECEESQGCSPTFNAFARRLAEDLVEKYSLREKRIIEIGCGKGEFLKLICSLGPNYGVGFDPGYIPGRSTHEVAPDRIEFIRDYYSEKYAAYQGDLICCRMTLEHIPDTAVFLETVRGSIRQRKQTIVFFQVPDVTRILRRCAFEDIYYEHCSYFSPDSLARLFRRTNFDIIDLRTAYNDQYILIEAKPTNTHQGYAYSSRKPVDTLAGLAVDFEKTYPSVLRHWKDQLDRCHRESKRVVLWGGGSKGVTFLNVIEGSAVIDYVVDINPYRQQTFMAGTGQLIVAPRFLRDYQPDIVIIMNSVYREEIQHDLHQLGLNPQVMTLAHRE